LVKKPTKPRAKPVAKADALVKKPTKPRAKPVAKAKTTVTPKIDALKPTRAKSRTKAKAAPQKIEDARGLAMAIVEAAWARNAFETRLLDVKNVASFTDIMVILSGRSDRQVSAIATEIEKVLKTKGVLPIGVEGRRGGTWILLDYGAVVVHVFEKTTRLYYELEKLWSEGVEIPVTEPVWVQEFTRMEGGDTTW